MRLAIIALLLAGTAAPAFAQSDDPSCRPRRPAREASPRRPAQGLPRRGDPDLFRAADRAAADRPPADAGTPAGIAALRSHQRVSALEQQIAQLTNQTEENDHRLTVLEQQFAKLKGDTDYRLNAIEGGAGGRPAGAAGAAGGPPPHPAAPVAAPFGPQGRKPAGGHDRRARRDRWRDEAADTAPPPRQRRAAARLAKTGDPAEDGYMAGYTLWSQKRYADAEAQLKHGRRQISQQQARQLRAESARPRLSRRRPALRRRRGLLHQLQAASHGRARARQPLLSRRDADPAQEERPRPARSMTSSATSTARPPTRRSRPASRRDAPMPSAAPDEELVERASRRSRRAAERRRRAGLRARRRAVSGGPDSCALLLLARVGRRGGRSR